MFSTRRPTTARRILGAVAVAGAITAVPLVAAGTASATPGADGPEVTEVKHGRDCHRDNPWDFLDNRRGPHDHCDPWDPWDRPEPWREGWLREHRPHGLFGSS